MRGYSATAVFTPLEIGLYRRAVHLVDCLPDRPDLRCHELARVVDRLLPPPPADPGPVGPPATPWSRRRVVDGWYGSVEHSWIEIHVLTPPPRRLSILDVYAVGSLPMVRLVEITPYACTLLRHDVYRETPPVDVYRAGLRIAICHDVIEALVREYGYLARSAGETIDDVLDDATQLRLS
jgi:hypothetical protein